MTPTPKRRWSFTLPTLFVMVTVAAILVWYSRLPGIVIVGEISRSDVSAICKVVESSGKVKKGSSILGMKLVAPGKVQVGTGNGDGPLSGSGCTLTLEKKNGEWLIVEYEYWMG